MDAAVNPEAAGVNPRKLQEAVAFVEQELEDGTFPGAALVAARHGNVFLERYWGVYCDREGQERPYLGTEINMLYSFSKGIASTVVVLAHQDGLLDYDTALGRYIPEFKGGGKERINLRLLLSHSAGIPTPHFSATYTAKQWDEAVAATCACAVEWEPGTKTAYHAATGQLLAAEAIRRVSGAEFRAMPGLEAWNEICRRRLFAPLGTRSFSYRIPGPEARLAVTPRPKARPWSLDAEHCGVLGHPGGGCFGTIPDMLKLLQLHLNQGAWEGKQLIRPEACAEMHAIQNAGPVAEARRSGRPYECWGLGWMLRGDSPPGWFGLGTLTSPHAFGHAGIDTVMSVGDPQRGLAILFLTTDSPMNADTNAPRLRNTITDKIVAAVKG